MRRLNRVAIACVACVFGGMLIFAPQARAGKLSWLDDVLEQVVKDARAEGKAAARTADKSLVRGSSRFFVHGADDGLETVARRFEGFSKTGKKVEAPAEALLETRFARLARAEPELGRTFRTLNATEKRMVVEMGETAQVLARRFPDQAEVLIRKLGPEGMAAARIYGPDVAETIAKEGPETLGVLRRTGRGGWNFFTKHVLPNKKKLIAAGVLAAFLANPEKFVNTAGDFTQFAVEQFSKAGIKLASAVGGGAARGLTNSFAQYLAGHGIDPNLARQGGMVVAGLLAALAVMVVLGVPIGWLLKPVFWLPRRLFRGRKDTQAAFHRG